MKKDMQRAELHVYTKHTKGCVSGFYDMVEAAEMKGLDTIAFADLGTTAGLYEAQRYNWHEPGKAILKTICGAEIYLVDDNNGITRNWKPGDRLRHYVVIDIETTGLSASKNEILEVAAIEVSDGWVKNRYHSYVKPNGAIPNHIVELTGIDEEMVKDAPTIDRVLPELLEFIGDSVVVGYNVDFDLQFLSAKAGHELSLVSVDALRLARVLLPDLAHHTLHAVAEEYGIGGGQHKAMEDAEVTRQVFERLMRGLSDRRVRMEDINRCLAFKTPIPYPDKAVILVQNDAGMRNLNILLSEADIKARKDGMPCLRKSEIEKHRDGLFIGSSAINGEVIGGLLSGKTAEEMERLLSFYDYVEICPIETLLGWLEKGWSDLYGTKKDVQGLIKNLSDVCEEHKKPLCAVSGSYQAFLNDTTAHKIAADYFGVAERRASFIRTTEEMLGEFAFLGKERAERIVARNTLDIAEQIELAYPIANEMEQPPVWRGMNEELRKACEEAVHILYGGEIPQEIGERLERELKAICDHGYATRYLSLYELLNRAGVKAGEFNFRGSSGNSFVSYLLGINGAVNPLKPHYRCKNVDYVEFPSTDVKMGYELPRKKCPVCGGELIKDGFGLSEYFFMGQELDKDPRFELNILSSKRKNMFEQAKNLKGVGDAVYGGTVHTLLSERLIGNIVDDYAQKNQIEFVDEERDALIEKLNGCVTGYGKHPGRIFIIPDYAGRAKEIFAVRKDKEGRRISVPEWHYFDDTYNSMNFLWNSMLDHVVRVADLTGIPQDSIALDDNELAKELELTEEERIDGIDGMYDLWSPFASELMQVCHVKDFGDVVKLLSLLHGTGVWYENGEQFISERKAGFGEIIASRDDVFDYLVGAGFDERTAFKIAERVRKGKGLLPEQEDELAEHGVPEWYIESCNKVRYLFPRSHSISYAIVLWRLLYYRKHYPEQFYRAYLDSVRIPERVRNLISMGEDTVVERLEEIAFGRGEEEFCEVPEDRSEEHALQVALLMYQEGYRVPGWEG